MGTPAWNLKQPLTAEQIADYRKAVLDSCNFEQLPPDKQGKAVEVLDILTPVLLNSTMSAMLQGMERGLSMVINFLKSDMEARLDANQSAAALVVRQNVRDLEMLREELLKDIPPEYHIEKSENQGS
jgi:hypothetical protein